MIAALWLGSAIFLMLAANAAFKAAPNPTAAADIVGAMLARWHYIALAAPLVLFAFELRNVRRGVLIALFVGVLFAAVQGFVDVRIRQIRWNSPIAISALSPSDPVRRTFGRLHGISMMLLLLQAITAAVVVMTKPNAIAIERIEREESKRVMSNWNDREDNTIYVVVVNDEEQYSIWPQGRELPLGWRDAGFSGPKQDCLNYIKEVWTDMRPLSLRKKMEEMGLG